MFLNEVGDIVGNFMTKASKSGKLHTKVIEILLGLIPKGDFPSSFKEF